jgi:isopentenyldiphosphate isomerase
MEILDIVNKEDKVIGALSKDEVYERNLRHRIVHILIFNKKGEIALQLRSANVSYRPLYWATAVGGHVQSGETYEQAALREYAEELGTQSELEFFSKDLYITPNIPLEKFIVAFKSIFEGPFNPDPKVVEKIEFFSLDKIKEMIAAGEKFHPELKFILEKYFFE